MNLLRAGVVEGDSSDRLARALDPFERDQFPRQVNPGRGTLTGREPPADDGRCRYCVNRPGENIMPLWRMARLEAVERNLPGRGL